MQDSPLLLALVSYPNNGKALKWFVMWMVKSKLAVCVQRINYAKSYYMREWEYKRSEEKILLIKCLWSKKDALQKYIEKNHPSNVPEIIFLNTLEVNQAYLDRAHKTIL
jgi:periplasmic divalent cation tolerance protein